MARAKNRTTSLVSLSEKMARDFRSGGRATATFAAGFFATVVEFATLDAFVVDYDDAWKGQKKVAGTAGDRTKLAAAAKATGWDIDTAAFRAHNKADASNKTLNKLKGYRSHVTGLLAYVRDIDRAEGSDAIWKDVSATEWDELRASMALAGSIENVKNFVLHGGTPDAPNSAPTTNRTATAPVAADDLREAVALLISESIDATCSAAVMKVWDHKISDLIETGRTRVARKAN